MRRLRRVFVFALTFFTAVTVFAGSTVAAQSTGNLLSPAYVPGTPANGGVYSLKSAAATATGSNAGVTFSGLGALESRYMSAVRAFPLYLKEQDAAGNADDLVKTYEVYFYTTNLRQIAFIQLERVNMPGNIDSSGDPVSELYLRGSLQRISGDPYNGTDLFYYQLHQN